jgi:hypothetical protein
LLSVLPKLGYARLVPRPGVDDERALGLALDQVDELDPSLALVEVDELATRLGLVGLVDVGDGRIRLDEERCSVRATQEVDDRHRQE